VLVGRDREREEIERALAGARAGSSAKLALVGESGIGKTALLADALDRANGMQVLRARGVESESEVPFASLLELLRPALGMRTQLSEPQLEALEGALALRPGVAHERFAVGAATLGLLAAFCESGPVAVLIDDAHWLDGASAQALLFAVRRLVADPIAVLIAVREGEPSLLDGADLPTLRIDGLSRHDTARLIPGLPANTVQRLHEATGGNPLAMLELAMDADDAALGPAGAPVPVSARVSGAVLRRIGNLGEPATRALVLAAASDDGDLVTLGSAAAELGVELSALERAENAGLVRLAGGSVEFRHPLARSAVYGSASAGQRREAHRALAAALPDQDVDRRAWHLAAAAIGPDQEAAAALEQAGIRGRERSSYPTAAAAFERAARHAAGSEQRVRLLLEAADAAWDAGLGDRASALLGEARAAGGDPTRAVEIDWLAGRIATSRGPVMHAYELLTAAAERVDGERAVAMLVDAASACFFAGDPVKMLAVAERARARLPDNPSVRPHFLAAIALGMARLVGGDAAEGAQAIHEAIALAESSAELRDDVQLLPWLAVGVISLRESGPARSLLEGALNSAREHAAIGALPFVLNLIARDQATTDRWALAEVSYREAIELARESGQEVQLVLGLAGLAWLDARRGREPECRAGATEALRLSDQLGLPLQEIWATAALGELELGLGDPASAIDRFEQQRRLLDDLGITDVDLSSAAELVESYLRLGQRDAAAAVAAEFDAAASAKGQPWPLARAARCQGLLAADAEMVDHFEQALRFHAETLDAFELGRTQLAYGERLRRSRNRTLARERLRAAVDTFETLGARPWADRARFELAATGETLRRRDPATIDELTPQELRIALQLAGGKTIREAAAALFLSPKTVDYHLRHVYQKLDIHSRGELSRALTDQSFIQLDTPVPERPAS
jgi:DNA-binding CsgD family transcriptional regulator